MAPNKDWPSRPVHIILTPTPSLCRAAIRMMDLGTAVGIVSLGLQVLEGVISYYSAYQDYGDDIVALCISSAALVQTLHLIHRKMQQKNSIPDRFRAHILTNIFQCNEGLLRLQKRLDKIKAQPVSLDKKSLSRIGRYSTNQLHIFIRV